MALLFVYGTLKRGDCRHQFLEHCRFVGTFQTCSGYRMYNLGEYPGLKVDPTGGSVEGELYEVTPADLVVLDDVEGVDEAWYARQPIELAGPDAPTGVEAYFYLGDVTDAPELQIRWNRLAG